MAVKSAFRLSTEKQSKEYVPLKGESRTGTSSPLSSSSSPLRAQSLIWQNLPAELRVEALRRAHLVQLLKQVNPELQLCRRSVTDVTSVRAKTTSDKGTQVPDIRFEFAGTRKGKPRAFVGLGVRIQPKQRPSSNNNNNNNNNNSNNNNSSVNTSYNNSNSNNNSYRSNSSYCGVRQPPPFPGGQFFTQRHPWIPPPPPRSFLRADAAPHIPRSILRNNARRNPEPSQVSSRRRVINMTSSEQTSLVDKEANKNVKKVASVEAKDPGGGDDKSIDVKCAEAPAEKINDASVGGAGASVGGAGGGVSSGDDDSVVVVLNEPRREQDLERKYGQFFCRRCLRGWSSRNLWCVRSTCKVYIKQTCNTCNKVVRPYLVCNLPLEEQNKKDYQPQQRHLAAA